MGGGGGFLTRRLWAIKSKLLLGNWASMMWDMLTWANLYGNRYKCTNKVSLSVHGLFSWVIQMALAMHLVEKVFSLAKISNEGFAFASVTELNSNIGKVRT